MQTRGWALTLTLLLSLVIPSVGFSDDRGSHNDNSQSQRHTPSALVKALRASLMNSYRHSAPPGYVPDPYCASGADGGAVGIHFVNFELAVDGVLDPAKPEVLYYEPLPGGRIRLAGAEYVYLQLPLGDPPVTPQHVGGHLLHYMTTPNRFPLPFDWLRLNVWAWKYNPNGTFASDNPNVSCDAYDPNLHPQPQSP